MRAFDEVYNLYANQVYKYLLCLTGDRNLAEELTQETFFKAYKNIHKFKGKCKMSVWLCQIAKNTYYTYYKKEKLRKSKLLDESILSGIDLQADFIRSDEIITLHRILHSLEEPYKEVFTLRVFGELSYKQISEIFGKSESWSRVTFYRAKEKIKGKFAEMEGRK